MDNFELDAETIAVLRDYREHTNRAILEHQKRRKAAKRRGERWASSQHAPGETWTETLSLDWMVAGPRYSWFPRERWPLLQVLRNQHGPAILDQLDALIDAAEVACG